MNLQAAAATSAAAVAIAESIAVVMVNRANIFKMLFKQNDIYTSTLCPVKTTYCLRVCVLCSFPTYYNALTIFLFILLKLLLIHKIFPSLECWYKSLKQFRLWCS